MKSLILATALIASSFAASAHEPVAPLQSYEVKVLESVEGETRTEFVKRIAVDFETFTRETGFEACGWVAYGGRAAFTVKMVTMKSQIACGLSKTDFVDGTFGTETIHSHPFTKAIKLNNVDKRLRGFPVTKLRTVSVNLCKFSSEDYSKPGFLIACGKVFYQTGRGTEKEI